jgi:surfactin family lipopeptide synthetase C
VLHCYEAFRRGTEVSLPQARPYRDYIEWLGRQDLRAARDYWRRQLQGFNTPTPVAPTTRPARHAHEGDETHAIRKLRLSDDDAKTLRDFAREQRLTANTLVKGAWAVLLAAWGGGDDVLFGSVVSGRPVDLPGAETMVGLLINTLPLRVRTAPGETLLPWLRRLQEQQIELQQFEYSPLVEVQRWSDVPRGTQMFESIVSFLNYPVRDAAGEWDGPTRVRELEFLERVNYGLALVASARDSLELELKYARALFDDEAAAQALALLEELLKQFAARPGARVEEFREVVGAAGRRQRAARQQEFKQARRRALEMAKRKGMPARRVAGEDER